MKLSTKNHDVAHALSAAFEPVIDVCLELGFTISELESLLRSAFVQRAFDKLPPDFRTGRPPTTNKVSVATGVHRNEVSKIRAGGSAMARETMQIKWGLYSKTTQVLNGWSTDPIYRERRLTPRFAVRAEQATTELGGSGRQVRTVNFPGTVLKELKRRGNVELLDGDIVRFKSANVHAKGVTPANVSRATLRMNRLGNTLFQKILDPEQVRLYAETGKIPLSASQMAGIRPILEQRAKAFLLSIEREFSARGVKEVDDQKSIGVGVFTWDEG